MTIEELRMKIDETDDAIVKLFIERMGYTNAIGEEKRKQNLPVKNELREKQLLERLSSSVEPEYSEAVYALYEKIMEISRNYQEKGKR